jgi:MFS family permease
MTLAYWSYAMFGVSVALFATGSLACALAPGMAALIAARAFQGVGGSGLIVVTISALGQMFDKTALIHRQG